MRKYYAAFPLFTFLATYFATAVLANIIFLTEFGSSWPAISISDFSWNNFTVTFGLEYWALILCPFLLAPLFAATGKMLAAPVLRFIKPAIQEIDRTTFTLTSALLYFYIYLSLLRAGAVQAILGGATGVETVEARFRLLENLGYWPQAAMMSLGVFLAVYSIIKALRRRGIFWTIFAALHVAALSLALLLLSMKWPLVLFLIMVAVCVFLYSPRLPIGHLALVGVLIVVAYFGTSIALLRLTNYDADGNRIVTEQSITNRIAVAITTNVPRLAVQAMNRMAISVPYYYEIFSIDRPCGDLLDRIKRKPSPCHPSTLVYESMFPADGFEGRGTAPAAIHISGYALQGWTGALIELGLAGLILGGFMAAWKYAASDIWAAIFAMGAYIGYFCSQSPIEATIIYPHGLTWWAIPVIAYGAIAMIISIGRYREAL